MNRVTKVSLLALGALLAQGTMAFGQAGPTVSPTPYGNSPYGYGTPRLSPYLNLLRGGNTAANYFMGVVPEVERRANAAQFSGQIRNLERQVQGTEESADLFPRLPETGHGTAFGNTGSYFANYGTQGRGIAGGAVSRPQSRPSGQPTAPKQ